MAVTAIMDFSPLLGGIKLILKVQKTLLSILNIFLVYSLSLISLNLDILVSRDKESF